MSFAKAQPVMAAVYAFTASILFAGIFTIGMEMRASSQSDAFAEHVASAVSSDLQAGDDAAARALVSGLGDGKAFLLSPDGHVIAGKRTTDLMATGRTYPVRLRDEESGTLVMERIVPGKLPLPLTIMIASVLLVTGVGYAMANYFAQLASLQAVSLRKLIKHLSFDQPRQPEDSPLLFQEFRFLRAAIVRRVLQLQRENAKLTNAAYTDERTGLGNSAHLTRQLTQFISRASFETPAAFVLVDAAGLQQFGELNDSAETLEMHSAIARRMTQFVSAQLDTLSLPKDFWPVFSLPSEHFGILVDRIGARPDIIKFVRALTAHLKEPYLVAGKTVRFSVFAGVAVMPEDGQSPQDIQKRANSALVQARRTEDGGVQFYSPKLDRQSAARKRLEAEVRNAAENGRFLPVFQPKIDLSSGKIVGAEALARWKLESGRIVSPNVFIPVAESCGLIGDIGMQITRQACEGAVAWLQRGFRDVSIAVNVSPLQFENDDLGSMIIDAMTDAGLPPRMLQLEITESVAVTDPERLKDIIGPLKTMGVRLAIDDFGTGHSNLAMLGRLPFDVFKIDRQFISNLHTDRQAPAIVEMILGMAETLGMETVAEGVETEEQQQFLRRRGCDQYQGYYFSPPVSLERFIEMLEENNRRAVA